MCFILSHLVISRSTVVDVLDFGRVISIATMTLTVNTANQRQHRQLRELYWKGKLLICGSSQIWGISGRWYSAISQKNCRFKSSEWAAPLLLCYSACYIIPKGARSYWKNTCESLLCQVTSKCDKECFHCNYAKYAFFFVITKIPPHARVKTLLQYMGHVVMAVWSNTILFKVI